MDGELYLLMGARGEYENYSETIYGVFTTRAAALAALARIPAESDLSWQKRLAFDARVDAEASRRGFPEEPVLAADGRVRLGFDRERFRATAEAKAQIRKDFGGVPSHFCESEEYAILPITIGKLWGIEFHEGEQIREPVGQT